VVHQILRNPEELRPGRPAHRGKTLNRFVSIVPGHDHRYAIDATKIMRELGWTPDESFASVLRKTAQWYLANEAW